ncbi:MAG: D-2-hydroxyacid dehydrogenase [Youngiibacter sp.]|nr:D-2-hydroxyacid dehydrogenase [Youngiibacter sp.]
MIANIVEREFLSKEAADFIRQETGEEIIDIMDIEAGKETLIKAEVIISQRKLTDELVRECKDLKWIQSFSAGVNVLPLQTLKEMGVTVTNTSGIHAPQMTDLAMGMILAFSRSLVEHIRYQKTLRWSREFSYGELLDSELLIIGSGKIGEMLAMKAKAFGMRTVGIKRTVTPLANFDSVRPVSELKEAMKTADYIVILLPLTPETRNLVDAEALGCMKESAVFVNLGRGPIVDENALYEILKNKRIRGAALDVFKREPLPDDSPLWELDNVIMTPHVGGWGPGNEMRGARLVADNIRRFRQGEKLINVVDPDMGY